MKRLRQALAKQQSKQHGFTLVEVVVSFAVLAILSGALMQMFVVSTRINRKAYDTDKASALTVHLQETFKADLAGTWSPVSTAPEFGLANVTSSAGVVSTIAAITTWTAWMDSDWNAVGNVADAWYEGIVELTQENPVPESGAYYPDADWVFQLPESLPASGFTLNLRLSSSDVSPYSYTAYLNGAGISESGTFGKKQHPVIQINHNGIGFILPLTIEIDNRAVFRDNAGVSLGNPELEVYLLDHDNPVPGVLDFVRIQGASAYSAINRSLGKQYANWMTSRVTRISDGTILGETASQAYHVENITP